jgi:hypothetical protein
MRIEGLRASRYIIRAEESCPEWYKSTLYGPLRLQMLVHVGVGSCGYSGGMFEKLPFPWTLASSIYHDCSEAGQLFRYIGG